VPTQEKVKMCKAHFHYSHFKLNIPP